MDNSIPDNYFERFPDELMNRIESMEDDLSSVAPKLVAIGKGERYTLPEGYFEETKAKLLLATTGATKKRIVNRKSLGLSVAALILLLMMFTGVLKDNNELEPLEFAQTMEGDDSAFFFSVASVSELEQWLNADMDLGLEDLTDDEIETIHSQIISDLSYEELSDEELIELL